MISAANLRFPDQRTLLEIAYNFAQRSPDPSTQVGAVLFDQPMYEGVSIVKPLMATGSWNRFPDNVEYTDDRWERPLKYEYIEHAERGCIYSAAFNGIETRGLGMACTWGPCADCARAIIQSGIRVFVTHKQAMDRSPDRWRDSLASAYTMLGEANVEIIVYDGDIYPRTKLLHTGELWTP